MGHPTQRAVWQVGAVARSTGKTSLTRGIAGLYLHNGGQGYGVDGNCYFLPASTRAEVRFCSRKDHVGFHTHNAEHNVCGLSRRGLLALSMCVVTKMCVENWFLEHQGKASAAQDDTAAQNDKSSSNVDETSQAHAEGLESKPDSPLNGLLSIFDTNEKTKSGKVLPKGYLKSARQVVKSLKESLKEKSGKEADVRRSADSAKEAIRDYLQNWRGQKVIESEDSYKALEGALKVLGKFYAKQGPRAMLPSDVKSQILTDLEVADAAL